MKHLIIVVFLFFYVNSNAQLEYILTENEWYLYTLSIEDQVFIPPVNNEMPFVELNFSDINSEIIFETQACNSGIGVVTIDENNYLLNFVDGIIDVTLSLCDLEENEPFDSAYFNFYVENAANPFDIYITFIDDPESNEELLVLELVSPNGDLAKYFNWILSNEDFNKSVYSLYPNPTNTEFFISTNSETNKYVVTIYDITGKLILFEEDKRSGESINIQSLKSGIYFVSIKDKIGNTSVKRIVKN